jgi:hypothetical protein
MPTFLLLVAILIGCAKTLAWSLRCKTACSVHRRGFRRSKHFETERDRKALLVDSVGPISNLRDMRDSIDNIDAAIIHMLAERFRCTRAVGKLKAQHGLPPSDPGREAEQVSHLRHSQLSAS